MSKWILTCVAITILGFVAEPVLAQGLRGRLRERRQGSAVVMSEPLTATTVTEAQTPILQTAASTAVVTSQPQVIQTRGGLLGRRRVTTVAAEPMLTPVVPATTTTIPQTVTPIPQAVTPMPLTQVEATTTVMTEPQVGQPRRGLLGRLRSRR